MQEIIIKMSRKDIANYMRECANDIEHKDISRKFIPNITKHLKEFNKDLEWKVKG